MEGTVGMDGTVGMEGTDGTASGRDTRPVLQVIIGSTRPGRIGPAFARWFVRVAQEHGAFAVELVDLNEVDLPIFDEPHHPRLGQYVHEHTKRWSATVERAQAYVFVTPEYNYGYNAALKNAIDYLNREWRDKAVSFVSYGGIAAGTRAVQALKQVVTTLRMVPVFESVNIPFAAGQLGEDGEVRPDEARDAAAVATLDELARLTRLLHPPTA